MAECLRRHARDDKPRHITSIFPGVLQVSLFVSNDEKLNRNELTFSLCCRKNQWVHDRTCCRRAGKVDECSTNMSREIFSYSDFSAGLIIALWHAIWAEFNEISRAVRHKETAPDDSTGVIETKLGEVDRIIESASSNWGRRCHAAAIETVDLQSSLERLHESLICLRNTVASDKSLAVLGVLTLVLDRALMLHVALKDVRRVPPGFAKAAIAPPVPLRLRCQRLLSV